MLGLLLMAGLGLAASAMMDHVDVHASDEPQNDADDTPAAASHGSLLDDQDTPQHEDTATHPAMADQGSAAQHDVPAPHGQIDVPSTKGLEASDPAPAASPTTAVPEAAQPVTTAHDAAAQDTVAQATAPLEPAAAAASSAAGTGAAAPLGKFFGTEANDTLVGTSHNDLMQGNGGDDVLKGNMGKDNLIAFDQGQDTLFGNRGDDTLHSFLVQHNPDESSFVVEDHQADRLHGGFGNDKLMLGSDDVGTGGQGSDQFHVSWDVEHGHPATIMDYNPKQDKLFVEFTKNRADDGLTEIKPEDSNLTTAPMKDGAGTSILLNGEAIAHVLGATNLHASDIGLIHA